MLDQKSILPENNRRLLVVDDDPDAREILTITFQNHGYDVISAEDGRVALQSLELRLPDAILLDIAMPDIDGHEVIRRIRSNPFWAHLPVVFITAHNQPDDIIAGLAAGADDYVSKPLHPSELVARVEAVLRRAPGGKLDFDQTWFAVGTLEVHRSSLKARIDGREVPLTMTEHRLLHTLMMNSGYPVAPTQLLQDVWEYPPNVGNPNTVHVTIKRLREKLETEPEYSNIIVTVRGRGYMINVES